MTPEELASDVRKSENAQIRKEALKESERGQHLKKVSHCLPIAFDTMCLLSVWNACVMPCLILARQHAASMARYFLHSLLAETAVLHERLWLPQVLLPQQLYPVCRQPQTSSSVASAGSARHSITRCRHGVLMSR